jgi:hypothetical protein
MASGLAIGKCMKGVQYFGDLECDFALASGAGAELAKSPGEWRVRTSSIYSRSSMISLLHRSRGDVAHLCRDGVCLNSQLCSPSMRTDDDRCNFGFTSLPRRLSSVEVSGDRLVNSAFANAQRGLRRSGRLSVLNLIRGQGICVDGLSRDRGYLRLASL